ncbi:MAG TPA: OB-fold nucleic acid binding domain-containing protein, partial [Thermoanaerobaculia bacterium]
MTTVRIKDLPQHAGEKVVVNGWLYNKRTAGKLQFPIIRDGSGYLQCVVFKKEVSEETWKAADEVTQESSVRVVGTVRDEARAIGGVELGVESFEVVDLAREYPITPKEHGTDFLMNHR